MHPARRVDAPAARTLHASHAPHDTATASLLDAVAADSLSPLLASITNPRPATTHEHALALVMHDIRSLRRRRRPVGMVWARARRLVALVERGAGDFTLGEWFDLLDCVDAYVSAGYIRTAGCKCGNPLGSCYPRYEVAS